MKITDKDIEAYRDIYYNYVIPLIKEGRCLEEIYMFILPALEKHGWTLNKFRLFRYIDLMQKMVKLHNINLSIAKIWFPFSFRFMFKRKKQPLLNLPELQCPIRSKQQINYEQV